MEIENIVGGEEDNYEGSSAGTPVDPVVIALALNASRVDSRLRRALTSYLLKQRALVGLQLRHFHEEQSLAIAAAKRKRLMDLFRIGLQGLIASLVLLALFAIAASVWDAYMDTGVKIDVFSVPGDVAAKGITGEVAAKQVLDRIAEIDRNVISARAANTYNNNWGKDLKLEVPETGVSVAEISRWIHDTFGRSTRIEGEVYHVRDQLAVSVRIGNGSAIQVAGTEAALPTLLQDAATRIYAQNQPYRYGYWLAARGEDKEAEAVFRQLSIDGNAADRLWAVHGLSQLAESDERRIFLETRVIATNRAFLPAYYVIAISESWRGHPEEALRTTYDVIKHARGTPDDTLSSFGRFYFVALAEHLRDTLLCDYARAVSIDSKMVDSLPVDNILALRAGERARQAYDYIELHDPDSASWVLELLPTPKFPHRETWGTLLLAQLAAARGDWQRAIALSGELLADDHALATLLDNPLFAAELYDRAGRSEQFEKMISSLPPDNYDGLRARARSASLRRNYVEGEMALAQAVKRAPSIPRAYLQWGDLLATEGNLEGAKVKYAEAHQRGPNWADPLKAWGDVLARQGHRQEALAKYDEALEHAPNWAALKFARDSQLKRSE